MKRNGILVVAVLFALSLSINTYAQRRIFPEVRSGVTWIMIYGNLKKGQEPTISPASIYLDRGKDTIFANESDTPIRIKFGKGTKCKEMQNIAFYGYNWQQLSGCIVSETLQPKASLKIIPNDPGPLDWEIEFIGANKKLSGTLKVF